MSYGEASPLPDHRLRAMLRRAGLVLVVLVLGLACLSRTPTALARSQVPILQPEVVAVYPHDERAFTQGLSVDNGQFLESTGRRGQSSLRRVEIETGEVIRQIALPDHIFGEGSVRFGDQVFVLSWQAQTGFIYDAETFEERGRFDYSGEGWGLTSDGDQLILSDGTPNLRFLDPQTLETSRQLSVTFNGQSVTGLNELEWVDGAIWANIWMTAAIVVIDPETGAVTKVLDLRHLVPQSVWADRDAVLNGIAWEEETGRLFVTGKLWPVLYEIRLPEDPVASP